MCSAVHDVAGASDEELLTELQGARASVLEQIRKRIIGQDEVVEQLLTVLFAKGHGLFMGVPGLAKTMLIHTLAEALGLRFSRIQFTPDLMPADITGTDVLEENRTSGERQFRFIAGPLFAQVILADEINRTPPKTQAALLQAMQELQVTAAGTTYPLELPFMVFATQNPIEQEGTYPLPEAQLDRFMFMVDVAYPSRVEEEQIVASTTGVEPEKIATVLDAERILAYQALVRRVPAAPHVVAHAVALARASRPGEGALQDVSEYVAFGAGPRAGQYLVLGAKARAALRGEAAASVEDVRALAKAVLRHRLIINFRGEAAGVAGAALVERILAEVRP